MQQSFRPGLFWEFGWSSHLLCLGGLGTRSEWIPTLMSRKELQRLCNGFSGWWNPPVRKEGKIWAEMNLARNAHQSVPVPLPLDPCLFPVNTISGFKWRSIWRLSKGHACKQSRLLSTFCCWERLQRSYTQEIWKVRTFMYFHQTLRSNKLWNTNN